MYCCCFLFHRDLNVTRTGVYETLCTQYMLAHNNRNDSKFAKGKKWNLFISYLGNLLIIPYQLTKFQVSISNNFRKLLLKSLKCPNLQRAIIPENFDGICSKVNQVIYSSSPISLPSFKPIVQILSRYPADKISFWFFKGS